MQHVKPFQMTQPNDISGLTKKENLAYQFAIAPQKATKVPIKIREANVGTDMNSYLSRVATKYFDTQDDFTWDIETGGDKNIPLVKAEINIGTTITESDQAGINESEFYMYFKQDWFFDTNIIVGEALEDYPIRILDDPTPVAGGLYRYRVKLELGDPNAFVPYEELTSGKRFSKEFSPVEHTMSTKGGGIHHDFPYTMRGSMSMLRMQDKVPGDMVAQPLAYYFKTKDGKVLKTWQDKRSHDFDQQFLKEINFALMYARSNMRADGTYTSKGKSGHYLKIGSGFKEQIRRSNFAAFNSFDIEELVSMMLDMSVGKLMFNERAVTLSTGEWGMWEFHKSMEELSSVFTPARDNYRIYGKGDGKMGYRGQFMEFEGPNGIKVKVMHDPTKDDPVRNKKYHPTKHGLLESYSYDILNMGTSSGESNLQKVTVKKFGEIRKWRSGLRSPYDYGEGSMETTEDAWEEHRAAIVGAMILDPERTGTYELNMQY